jgi:hypothetical protein
MTNEERDIISQFIARVGGAPAPSGFAASGSVPATQQAPLAAPLPPVDRDADALIAQMFQRFPEASYRMTQLAFVQEQGLIQAQSRIAEMEAELHRARQVVQQAQQSQQAAPQSQPQAGGFFSGLFGGGRQPPPSSAPQAPNPGPWGGQRAAAPPPGYTPPPAGYAQPPGYAPPPGQQPQYAPGYQPGMFQRSGSGFLGSALTTAAGVAGGMVAGNMLSNLFSGEHHGGSAFASPAAASPWSGTQAADQGVLGSGMAPSSPSSDQDYVDNGSWDTPPAQDNSWADNSGTDSGSSDSGGSSDDDTF